MKNLKAVQVVCSDTQTVSQTGENWWMQRTVIIKEDGSVWERHEDNFNRNGTFCCIYDPEHN